MYHMEYLLLETYVRVCYDENMMNLESGRSRKYIIRGTTKADVILIIVCLLTATLLGIFFVVHHKSGSTVRILYGGTELKKIALDSVQTGPGTKAGEGYYLVTCRDDVANVEYFSDKPELKLVEGTSYNLILLTDGTVIVEVADCRDQICVHHKPISSSGESIICLPHRIVVEIDSGENSAVNIQEEKQDGNLNEMSDEPLDGVVR